MSVFAPEQVADSLAELMERLGGVPPERIRCIPPPGTATEQDVIAYESATGRLCELVDGVLVEKAMAFYESLIAIVLGRFLQEFVSRHKLGVVAGADGSMKLAPGLVRIPDVSFISWARLPGGKIPRAPIPALFPDLAVEVLSESNTKAEIQRKLGEYFEAGTRLAWIIDPRTRTARAYTTAEQFAQMTEDDLLDGGEVLPGFELSLRQLFEEAGPREE